MRLQLDTPENCRKSLSTLANAVVNKKLEPREANSAAYIINIALSAIRTDVQEARIQEIENQLEELMHGE